MSTANIQQMTLVVCLKKGNFPTSISVHFQQGGVIIGYVLYTYENYTN